MGNDVMFFLFFLILALAGIGYAVYRIWKVNQEIKKGFEYIIFYLEFGPNPSFDDAEEEEV